MIRVLIAEDMHMIRGALTALLGLESDIEVVAEADNGEDAVAKAAELAPDVAPRAGPGIDWGFVGVY